jgi:steroid 5-alpha reductase family enzyme
MLHERQESFRAGSEVTLAYLCALSASWAWLDAVPASKQLHPLWAMFVAHVLSTLVVFAFSLTRKNSSFFDPYWSVIPAFTVLYWGGLDTIAEWGARRWLLVVLVNLWSWRLTFNWWRQWKGLEHEDWRYVDLRAKTGPWFFWVNLSGIHLFPAVLVFMGCMPMWVAMGSSTETFGAFEGLGAAVMVIAVWFEATADRQLHEYRASGPPAGDYIHSGLWRYSRHPNYFGEITFWWGVWLYGLGTSLDAAWMVMGAVSMVLLFRFISIPMIERRTLAKRPRYAECQRTTSMIVPLPPRA